MTLRPETRGAVLARQVAGFGLPGADAAPIEVEPTTWPGFAETVAGQRLTGLATAAAEAGWLRLTDEQSEDLLQRHQDAMIWSLLIERKLLTLATAFERNRIDAIVIKGPALAHSVYPDPSWRVFGDLDLLVQTSDWRRTCDLLEGLGFDRRLPEPRPGFDERFGKAAVHTNGDGVEVDLHRTLVLGPFGLWIQPDELFRRTTGFSLGGRVLHRLDDTALFLHACVHAVLGGNPPRVSALRDVPQVAHARNVDWDAVASLSSEWRLGPVIRSALIVSSNTLGVTIPESARHMADGEPTRRERRILESYSVTRRGRGGTSLSTLRAIPGVRQKAAYVRALLFPEQEFLDARRTRSFRRLLVPMKWLARRRG